MQRIDPGVSILLRLGMDLWLSFTLRAASGYHAADRGSNSNCALMQIKSHRSFLRLNDYLCRA